MSSRQAGVSASAGAVSGSLEQYIAPLMPLLSDASHTEIVINKPDEAITESRNGWKYHKVDLPAGRIKQLAALIATHSGQRLNDTDPLLSATLPSGERIQIAVPPAVRPGCISMTVRKPSDVSYTLAQYREQGMFDSCEEEPDGLDATEKTLLDLKKRRRYEEFLTLAVQSRKNIILSGSTGSGKTTFLKSLLALIPEDERLISIENVDELRLYDTHPNSVALFYSAGGQGRTAITQQQLLESALRMRPDRVFLAELIRGNEAFYYLRNVNSGHPGSMTTMHSGSPRMALEQLVLFIKESDGGGGLNRDDIKHLLHMCVDVIVQLKNISGKRLITDIYYDPESRRRASV